MVELILQKAQFNFQNCVFKIKLSLYTCKIVSTLRNDIWGNYLRVLRHPEV